jgi:hypothetical protein
VSAITADRLTLGDVARSHGIALHNLRRLFTRGVIPEPGRVAHMRVIRREDLPRVLDAARAAGYLAPQAGEGGDHAA